MEPDFEIIPFVEAVARLCVCFRSGDDLVFVIADPLDAQSRGRVDQRMRARPHVRYEWRLATVGDVTAYLAAREKTSTRWIPLPSRSWSTARRNRPRWR
jgi:general secretion pathway protein E